VVGQAAEGKQGVHEVTIVLGSVEELFAPPTVHPFGELGALLSGIERLVEQLKATYRKHRLRAVIVLENVGDGNPAVLAQQVGPAISRYCELRIHELEHQRASLRRDGLSALTIGIPLLLVGILLSELFRRSGAPDLVTTFVADGLLLVIAWVALWYPLDTLVYYGRPLSREIRVLRAMQHMEVVVRDGGTSRTD
jgi:hypothetical protein